MSIQIINETPEEHTKRVKKIQKKFERHESMLRFFRFIIYSPLEIIFNILSFIFKLLAYLLSFPLIFFIGKFIYIIFKDNNFVLQDFCNILIFIVLPFLMFFIHQILEKIADYFGINKY